MGLGSLSPSLLMARAARAQLHQNSIWSRQCIAGAARNGTGLSEETAGLKIHTGTMERSVKKFWERTAAHRCVSQDLGQDPDWSQPGALCRTGTFPAVPQSSAVMFRTAGRGVSCCCTVPAESPAARHQQGRRFHLVLLCWDTEQVVVAAAVTLLCLCSQGCVCCQGWPCCQGCPWGVPAARGVPGCARDCSWCQGCSWGCP